LLRRSKEFIMHAFRNLLVVTLASITLAAPIFGSLSPTFAAANVAEEKLAASNNSPISRERHIWRGPYDTREAADAAGKNAVRNQGAIRYAGPAYRGSGNAEGWYVLLTFDD
jgi:hypothetical protein